MGLTCDFIPLFALAERYHGRAVAWAERIQHPLAIGHAYLGMALHRHCLGDWSKAIELCRRASAAYQQAGDLRGLGAASAMASWALGNLGSFEASLDQSRQTIRQGEDGGDHQVWGWGLLGLAQALWRIGQLQDAVTHFEHAISRLRGVPDY